MKTIHSPQHYDFRANVIFHVDLFFTACLWKSDRIRREVSSMLLIHCQTVVKRMTAPCWYFFYGPLLDAYSQQINENLVSNLC